MSKLTEFKKANRERINQEWGAKHPNGLFEARISTLTPSCSFSHQNEAYKAGYAPKGFSVRINGDRPIQTSNWVTGPCIYGVKVYKNKDFEKVKLWWTKNSGNPEVLVKFEKLFFKTGQDLREATQVLTQAWITAINATPKDQ